MDALRFRMLVVVALIASALGVRPRTAGADEIAPELLTLELRLKAQAELRALSATLEDADRRRLVGLYLAFDPSPSDPLATVACDDDGDYVIVASDAMLRLVEDIARASVFDFAAVERYATFLDDSQVPGRRLLPPPPGLYDAAASADGRDDERLRAALAFVLAVELERLRAGDLVCPHPTATKEHGDDEWTLDEQRRARETAASVYPAHAGERDASAATRVVASGRALSGALAVTRFFTAMASRPSRFVPTYSRLHPAAPRSTMIGSLLRRS